MEMMKRCCHPYKECHHPQSIETSTFSPPARICPEIIFPILILYLSYCLVSLFILIGNSRSSTFERCDVEILFVVGNWNFILFSTFLNCNNGIKEREMSN